MADETLFNNVHAQYVPMEAGASIGDFDRNVKFGTQHAGKAVMKNGEGVVELVTNGKPVFGQLVKLEDDEFCTVQDEGYVELPTDGSAITYADTNDSLVGGTVAGTVKSGGGVGANAACQAIKPAGTDKVYAKLR